jgi:hypothetical protein
MSLSLVELSALFFAAVFVSALILQWWIGAIEQGKVAKKLQNYRELKPKRSWGKRLPRGLTFAMQPEGKGAQAHQSLKAAKSAKSAKTAKTAKTVDKSVPRRDLLVNDQKIEAFVWAEERKHWDEQAEKIRTTFLERTQATAEKWRNIFAGLLAVFGSVLVINKPDLSATSDPDLVRRAIIVALILGLHAVAYTGWAAAGLPKMLVDVNAETAFEAETLQACRTLPRLRIGLVCGGATAVLLTLALAAAMSP